MKPLRGMAAVYLREMLILRRRILKQFASWLVSPLLYLVAFHYAMNDTLVGSRPYADFLLPGQAWTRGRKRRAARHLLVYGQL